MSGEMIERRFLLVKRGLYYGPDNCGYTGFKERAGRYLESEAYPDGGVTAVHEDDAAEIAPNCFEDLAREWLWGKLEESRAETEALRAELSSLRGEGEKRVVRKSAINGGNIVIDGEEWVPIEAYREAMSGWTAANARHASSVTDALESMAEALKPFADCCEYIADDEDDDEWAKFRLVIKNYRDARQALASIPTPDDKP